VASIMQRLEHGERCWPAELVLRAAGLGLLYLCVLLSRSLCRLVDQPPPHQASPAEFALAAVVFLCLSSGLALLIIGPGLFQLVPRPPRAMLP
jgi:cytochrome b561